MPVASDIPPEIWLEVLVYQDALDILRLRLLCRSMLDIIDGSSYAQYMIECFCAGVHDELHAGLSYAERLAVLRKRESAWRTMTPQRRYDIPLRYSPSGLYDLTGGAFLLGLNSNPEFMHTSGYSALRLPSSGDPDGGEEPRWKDFELGLDIVDFGLSVQDQDLAAIVTQRQIEGPPPEGNGLHIMLAKFEMHLWQFSTGESHPEARQPVITLREQGLVIQRSHAVIEVVGDLVVVLLFFPYMIGMRLDNMYIIKWKSGEIYRHLPFIPHQYKCFVFLDQYTLMLPNLRTFALDIFKIDVDDEMKVMGLNRICILSLPQKLPGVRMISCQCRSEPNGTPPDFAPMMPPPTSRPFRDSPENAIVLLSMSFMYAPHSLTSMSMIVHREGILKAAASAVGSGKKPEEAVPYDWWGVDITSWFDSAAGWITQSTGNKFVCLTHDSSYTAIRVYDFNQRNVRRHLAQHGAKPVWEGGNRVQVVNERRQLEALAWFAKPIEFGLAHVQSTLEEVCTADGVLIDEENILVVTTDRTTYRIKTVEGLLFG